MTLKDVRMVHGGINMSFFFLYFFLFAFFYRNDTERLRRDGLALDAVIQPRLYSHSPFHVSVSLAVSFNVVQTAEQLPLVTPCCFFSSDLSRRFYSRSSRLTSLVHSRLLRSTSIVDVAGVEGYHRILYHISYYNTACYNSGAVSIGFALFLS